MADRNPAGWTLPPGSFVDRLVCHRRLPLIAAVDRTRAAVHVWELGPGGPVGHGVVGTGAGPAGPWERELFPSPAWHPREPRLVVTAASGLRGWTPGGAFVPAGAAPDAAYADVAFSPDGRTLWASPVSPDEDEPRSDALDLVTGARRDGPWWDTGVVEHPGGGLVVTLSNDQAATDVLFARPGETVPAVLRVFRDAITLGVDGYGPPVLSGDGRYLALLGNAYVRSVDVFEFPSLRRVLQRDLGEQEGWPPHDIAFAPGSDTLLVGTAAGGVLAIDLGRGTTTEVRVAAGPVSALGVLPTGQLVVADRTGRVAALDVPVDAVRDPRSEPAAARARAEAFLAATAELPGDADLEESLVRHDGDG